MKVPLFDLTEQNAALQPQFEAAARRILESNQFILGRETEEFEAELAAAAGVPHAVAVSSGTDALVLALMLMGIRPGDEVLCPDFTFFATAGSVARLGAVPVFVDVDPVTFNLDVADAARKVTPKTKAVIPVHLFGQAADMDGVMDLARRHKLLVLEDAAQAIGALYKGRTVGNFGDFTAVSFYPTKNLGGFGDGGALFCRSAGAAEKAKTFRNHGMHLRYHHRWVGGNFRLDNLQCALLRVKLPLMGSYAEKRAANAALYLELLGSVPGLVLPRIGPDRISIWNQFTVRVAGGKRDALRAALAGKDIGTEVYYPLPLSRQECFSHLPPSPCPVTETLCAEVLSLPIFPELGADRVRHVAAVLKESLTCL
jgi:dTDP-4-amino-4,6-dideoxygalactose transaminase